MNDEADGNVKKDSEDGNDGVASYVIGNELEKLFDHDEHYDDDKIVFFEKLRLKLKKVLQ